MRGSSQSRGKPKVGENQLQMTLTEAVEPVKLKVSCISYFFFFELLWKINFLFV